MKGKNRSTWEFMRLQEGFPGGAYFGQRGDGKEGKLECEQNLLRRKKGLVGEASDSKREGSTLNRE